MFCGKIVNYNWIKLKLETYLCISFRKVVFHVNIDFLLVFVNRNESFVNRFQVLLTNNIRSLVPLFSKTSEDASRVHLTHHYTRKFFVDMFVTVKANFYLQKASKILCERIKTSCLHSFLQQHNTAMMFVRVNCIKFDPNGHFVVTARWMQASMSRLATIGTG